MQSDFSAVQIAALTAFVVSFLATRGLIAAHLNDSPDDPRKLHQDHKATSGGIAIIAGVAASLIYLHANSNLLNDKYVYFALGGGAIFGLIGLVDDLLTLGSRFRMFALLAIAGAIAYSPLRVEEIRLFSNFNLSMGAVFGAIGTLLWIALIVNAVNFIDGINGISIGSMAIALICLSFIAFNHNEFELNAMIFTSAAACLGFLVFNVVKGNIFAGDVGSWFIGGWFGVVSLIAVKVGISPFAIAICVLPILAEVVLTIIYRIRLGENILTPHNKHIYQKLVRSGKGHLHVASIWWAMTLVCGIIANIIDQKAQNHIFMAFLIILSAYIAFAMIARKKLKKLLSD